MIMDFRISPLMLRRYQPAMDSSGYHQRQQRHAHDWQIAMYYPPQNPWATPAAVGVVITKSVADNILVML